MHKSWQIGLTLVIVWAIGSGCGDTESKENNTKKKGEQVNYRPDVSPADFRTGITNPFFPLTPGEKWLYEAKTEDGFEQIIVEVLPETRTVWGVEATIVRDTVYVDGELAEDTWDWFAEDKDGNVWYLGEETYEYEDDEIVSSDGAWEAGVDGALPGIVMPGSPEVGEPYYQEYYEGEAEDTGQIVAVDVTVEIGLGTYTGCVKTNDTTPLDPEVNEFKTYCPGIGVVLEEEEETRVELISHIDETYDPGVTADDFSDSVDNPYFPLAVGTRWVYEAKIEDGIERIETEVSADTKKVFGLTAVVIRDTAYVDDEMVEDTWDWFLPDNDGNIWYLGEETYEYEDGNGKGDVFNLLNYLDTIRPIHPP